MKLRNLFKNNKTKNNSLTSSDAVFSVYGFTLVEMMISLAIFAVVAVVAMGAFLKIIEANKKSQAIKVAVNNLNFAFEAMSRDLRIANNYNANSGNLVNWNTMPGPTDSLAGGSSGIGFVSNPVTVRDLRFNGGVPTTIYPKAAYRYNSTSKTIEKADQMTGRTANNVEYYPIVSVNDLDVEDLKFYVHNADGLNGQPYVFITAKVKAGAKTSDKVEFLLQTTVSQRLTK